ncbi:MAG: hypothetical protein ACRYFU_12920, partial [Janthinobacterium lividum]
SGTATNNVIMTNCNALRQSIPGTPSGFNSKLGDFCRAADTGILLTVGKGATTRFDFNTVYSASQTGVEVECDPTAGACDATSLIDFRNNVFLGFTNNVANGYVHGGTNDYSNPLYDGTGIWPFGNPGSLFANNDIFHGKSNFVCPAGNELNGLCGDPKLADETWHNYGYSNVEPVAGSTVLGTGVTIGGITIDYTGQTRSTPPSIGAYDK